MGFFGALCLLFVALKLSGVIHWPWSIVLLPAYGQAILFAVVVLWLSLANSSK